VPQPRAPAVADEAVDAARELARETWDAVRPVCIALAVVFAAFLGFNLLRSPHAMTARVVAVQVITVAWFVGLALGARRTMPAPAIAQASGISISVAAAACTAVVCRATGDALVVGLIGIPVMGVLALVLSTRWAVGAAALCALVTFAAPPRRLPLLDVAGILATSALVGLAVHVARRRTHARVGELRAKELAAHDERIRATARLAGGLGHDFNNLLNVIAGEAMVLADDDLPPDERAVAIASLEEAAGRAAAVTRQLLAFSRRQLVSPTRVAPMAELARLERMLRRSLPATISIELGGDARSAMIIDAGQLGQAVLNLALNARDAMPAGGALRLRARDVQLDGGDPAGAGPGHVSSPHRPGAYVAIDVEDTGAGMDDATLAHLFEPFFTTKAAGRGTGLGLSMVHGIVHQHGGFVEVASRVGRGTTFTLFVPAAADATAAAPAALPEGAADARADAPAGDQGATTNGTGAQATTRQVMT